MWLRFGDFFQSYRPNGISYKLLEQNEQNPPPNRRRSNASSIHNSIIVIPNNERDMDTSIYDVSTIRFLYSLDMFHSFTRNDNYLLWINRSYVVHH